MVLKRHPIICIHLFFSFCIVVRRILIFFEWINNRLILSLFILTYSFDDSFIQWTTFSLFGSMLPIIYHIPNIKLNICVERLWCCCTVVIWEDNIQYLWIDQKHVTNALIHSVCFLGAPTKMNVKWFYFLFYTRRTHLNIFTKQSHKDDESTTRLVIFY